MSDRLKKQDLARNELGEIVAHGIEYAGGHQRQLLLAIGAVVAAGVLGFAGWLFWRERVASTNELLSRALAAYSAPIAATGAQPDDPVKPSFASETARRDRAKQLFAELAGRSLAPRAAHLADLYLGEIAHASADRAAARRHWQRFLDSAEPGLLASAAALNLIRLDREDGKGEELAARLRQMIESPTARSLPEDALLFQLGLTLEALGKSADAKAAFRRVVEEFPRSPYVGEARRLAGPASLAS